MFCSSDSSPGSDVFVHVCACRDKTVGWLPLSPGSQASQSAGLQGHIGCCYLHVSLSGSIGTLA